MGPIWSGEISRRRIRTSNCEWHIRNAIVGPRDALSSYLSQKPIAKYLHRAEEHLLGTSNLTGTKIQKEEDD